LAELKGRHRVIALIPMTENMPGGRAFRPGDVITGASGKTVEILNTDAEGRLVLADALWYAQQLGATHLVDVAPPKWVEAVHTAADEAGDRVWPLPLFDEYREQLRSEIADLANVGGRPAGA